MSYKGSKFVRQPCKFNNECTKADCTYTHTVVPPKVARQITLCSFENKCYSFKCSKFHAEKPSLVVPSCPVTEIEQASSVSFTETEELCAKFMSLFEQSGNYAETLYNEFKLENPGIVFDYSDNDDSETGSDSNSNSVDWSQYASDLEDEDVDVDDDDDDSYADFESDMEEEQEDELEDD